MSRHSRPRLPPRSRPWERQGRIPHRCRCRRRCCRPHRRRRRRSPPRRTGASSGRPGAWDRRGAPAWRGRPPPSCQPRWPGRTRDGRPSAGPPRGGGPRPRSRSRAFICAWRAGGRCWLEPSLSLSLSLGARGGERGGSAGWGRSVVAQPLAPPPWRPTTDLAAAAAAAPGRKQTLKPAAHSSPPSFPGWFVKVGRYDRRLLLLYYVVE